MGFDKVGVNTDNITDFSGPHSVWAQASRIWVSDGFAWHEARAIAAVVPGHTTYGGIVAVEAPVSAPSMSIGDASFCSPDNTKGTDSCHVTWLNPLNFQTHMEYSVDGVLINSEDFGVHQTSFTFVHPRTTNDFAHSPGQSITAHFFNIAGTGSSSTVTTETTKFNCP